MSENRDSSQLLTSKLTGPGLKVIVGMTIAIAGVVKLREKAVEWPTRTMIVSLIHSLKKGFLLFAFPIIVYTLLAY